MGHAFLILIFLAWPHALSAAGFADVLQNNDPRVVASDKDATAFFLDTFGPSLELSGGLPQRGRTPPPLPKELSQHLSAFVTHLATWHLTHDLLASLTQGKTALTQTILEQQQRQIEWLKQTQQDLPGLLALVKAITQLQPPAPPTHALSSSHAVFTQFLHAQYPNWTGTPDSWLTLAQTEGVTGVQKRLRDSWDRLPAQGGRDEKSLERDPAPSINLFLRQSFLPIATAHVKAGLLQWQIKNEQQAWTTWQAMQTWSNDRKNEQGLRRLCGTWQWLIHNHQNHGDHKTVMIYPPPSQYHRMTPRPAAVRVRGDTVYIRWELPRGIVQEESLLFGEKDQLLSGTFVNNLGPNGNITARRIKPCQEIEN